MSKPWLTMLKCLESAIAICLLRECRITSLISSPRRGDTKNYYSIRVIGIRHLEISKLSNHWNRCKIILLIISFTRGISREIVEKISFLFKGIYTRNKRMIVAHILNSTIQYLISYFINFENNNCYFFLK